MPTPIHLSSHFHFSWVNFLSDQGEKNLGMRVFMRPFKSCPFGKNLNVLPMRVTLTQVQVQVVMNKTHEHLGGLLHDDCWVGGKCVTATTKHQKQDACCFKFSFPFESLF